MNNTSSTIVSDTELTTEEITKASRHLSITRGSLVESVSGLSAAQWNFKPQMTSGPSLRTWSMSF